MANEAGWSYWSVIPRIKPGSVKGLEAQLNGSDFQGAGRMAGDNLGTNIGTSAKKRVGLMTKGIVAPLLTAVAAVGVKDFISDSLGEARESQKVGALTASIIKSTGGAAKVTAKDVDRLSSSISKKTGVDDEQIASGANLLLTFKNVKREGSGLSDIFGRATAAAADLSAAGFGDLSGQAKMLGKALNDPVKGISALSRSGVTFSEQQKATIKQLVAQNDVLGAQKIILKEVESQVGGAAAATATLGEKSEVAWGNIQEGFGTALLPLVDDMQTAFLEKGVPAAEKFVGWFQEEGVPALREFGDVAGPLAKSTLPAIGTSLGIVADGAKALAPAVKSIIDSFNSLPKAAQTAIIAGAGTAYVGNKVLGALPSGKTGGKAGLLGKVASKAEKTPVVAAPGLLNPVTGSILGGGLAAYGAYKVGQQVKNDLGKVPMSGLRAYGNGGEDRRSQQQKDEQAAAAAKQNIEYMRQSTEMVAKNEARRKVATQATIDGFNLEKAKAGEVGESLDILGLKSPRPAVKPVGLVEALKNSSNLGLGLDQIDRKKPNPKISLPGMSTALGATNGLLGNLDAIDGKNVKATVSLAARGANLGAILGQIREIERRGKSGGGRVRGFDGGGWTGPGSRLDVAGVVHADEFVTKKTSRQSIERQAPGALDYMNQTGQLVTAGGGGGGMTYDQAERLITAVTAGHRLSVGMREFALLQQDADDMNRRLR